MFAPLAVASSVLYLYMIYSLNVIGKYIVKPATTILIIGVALETDQVRNDIKLAGLIFSLFGDAFLMFEGDLYFILGLLSFLTAHIFYIKMFYNTKKSTHNTGILITLFSIGAIYFAFLFNDIYAEGGVVLSGAVIIYVSAITTMGYYALLNNNSALSFGVIMFIISDATLAYNKFVVKSSQGGLEYVVMITYHIAQFLIAQY